MVTTSKRANKATEDRATFAIPSSIDHQEVLDQAFRSLRQRDPNIVGVRFGNRRVNGKVRPDEQSLIVLITNKIQDESKIDPSKLVPKELMGIPTDVVEIFPPDGPDEALDFTSQEHQQLSDDLSMIDWGLLHEISSSIAAPVVAHATRVQDFGDVCVVEDDGTLVKTAPNGQQYVDYVRGYQLFRTLHADDYDFVTFVTDSASGLPPQGGASFWSGIYNNVQGIGLGTFNSRAAWGTSRLQGFHFINQGHFPLWRYVMLQEFGHQFGAFVRYRDPLTNATMTDHLLGGVPGHWALNFDDEKSPMDYDFNDWVELPGGTFRQVTISSDSRVYSNLDLYLMGLLGPSEVGEFTVLRNPTPVSGSSTDFTATPARVNIQHVIAQEGPRVPAASSSPKHWREAFIVLTRNIHGVHDLVETVDTLRLRWERDFSEATKYLGRIDTVLDARPGRITPSQIESLVSGGYTGLHRHLIDPSDLRVVRTQFTGQLNPGQTKSWFTFNWPTNWFVVWSLQPTTGGGKITWDVAIERAPNNTFTYWLTVTNTGPVATTFDGKYAILM